MRRIVTTTMTLAAALGVLGRGAGAQTDPGRPAAAAPAAQPPAPDPDAPRKLEQLLKLWEQNSSRVTQLDVKFTRVDKAQGGIFNGPEMFLGRALLKSPNLAFLDLRKVKLDANNKPVRDAEGQYAAEAHERIICTGDEVWQILPPTRQIIIHPLAQDQKQRALEEGPLPFLFNMRAEEAKRRYEMTLVGESEQAYLVKIIPRLEIDRESFRQAYAQIDKTLLQPLWLRLDDINGTDTKEFWFTASDFKANAAVNDANFRPQASSYPNFKVERNIAGAAPTQSASRTAPPGAPAARRPSAAPAQPATAPTRRR